MGGGRTGWGLGYRSGKKRDAVIFVSSLSEFVFVFKNKVGEGEQEGRLINTERPPLEKNLFFGKGTAG